MKPLRIQILLLSGGLVLGTISQLSAQEFNPTMWQELRWRCIGPFRAGRTIGAAGVPSQPNVFYIGVNNGGVWKTTDAGRTWNPIFDDQPTGSIGDIAVAPSNPDIIYVGSGEGVQRPDLSVGDGLYKSSDGGKTWKNTGLQMAQQIGSVVIDPRDPNRVFVAALGHPYGPNEERGVYRSLDGGGSWQKVLYKDVNTGAIQVDFAPDNPDTVYAVLWAARQGPWENGEWQGPNSGFFKSTDGGNTWRQLTNGLPTTADGLGRIGFGISRSSPNIIYATVDAPRVGGIFRSDDAGETWHRTCTDSRVWGRGSDFAEIRPDPKNPETVYVANTCSYKSTDGGKTFTAFKGAPGGDDYHRIWINPDNPDIMLFCVDQGATITVNGGKTWSSWYNQPTAQFYHVITDDRFPYWVYGAQQESGSIGIASRGDYGAVTWRDWRTVGVEEYGYVAPDPLHPNYIFGGKVTKLDWATGQVQNVAPGEGPEGRHRSLRTAPLVFSTVDPHLLFLAENFVFVTGDGGQNWKVISPDLTREHPDVPESIGVYRSPDMSQMPRRGVIYTVAPSYKDVKVIWAGTDDGLIHITTDGGKTWNNVTPPGLTSWSKVSVMDAGRFDAQTAYAAVNRFRLDDLRPHIYRTHDGGKSWTEITNGIPQNEVVNTVREDPVRRGLLFAGTERAVHVSFDDGDHWQPLRLNMPATAIRDLVIHNDDVVVGTHGRSFWILDDITALRQLDAKVASSGAFLFKPQTAWRVRRSANTDTPIPPEEPMGQNPPDGAIIDYLLGSDAPEATLEILDDKGALVRRYSSKDEPVVVDPGTQAYPPYWFRAPKVLSAKAGMQRWVWDLHYAPPEGEAHSFPISAIPHDTPPGPTGPLAFPGEYTARFTALGQTQTQHFTLKLDPRVTTSKAGLAKMFEVSHGAYAGAQNARAAAREVRTLRAQVRQRQANAGALAEALGALDQKLTALAGADTGGGGRRGRRGGGGGEKTLSGVEGELNGLSATVEEADAEPTGQQAASARNAQKTLADLLGRWNQIKQHDVPALNEKLKAANLPVLAL